MRRSVRWPYDADDKTKLVELYVANDYSQVLHTLWQLKLKITFVKSPGD